jgi:hypothetical protein
MIDFSTCKNCDRPIFFDWKGAHHVKPESALAAAQFGVFDERVDFSHPECDSPEEAPEEE